MKGAFPEPEIVTHKGKPVSVILAIKDYEELLERVAGAGAVAVQSRARRSALRDSVLQKHKATGLPVSVGRRPIKAAEVEKLLAESS
jgi:hypothetical protein